ncbi:OmpH family outer membrane protein [Planomicrobium sp. CPCC 101110]|uniref:OmpH family outer membrane protein n=1 Tax=Planomicrobium sp. CPCC 101110 TaxID=2599619 RepID=UPI0011B3DB77|nr:OmpH family outer membrane protein [Planomicrobium sp. CPCC 101110]TWT27387.1 hypothetical protein FQV30_02390 [Planomicrobium sp. CPCC 101110]
MFKKSFAAALFSIILAVMGSTSAFAAEPASPEVEKALVKIEETNDKIYAEVEKTQVKAQTLYEQYLENLKKEQATEKKAQLTAEYERNIEALIAELDQKTQELTRAGVEKVTEAGITVEIQWVLYQFADREAWIDPIMVVGW